MASRPNILLITTDQQRADTVHALGNPSILTPHLNWLVDTGVVFRRAYADCPICVPSRATIMTGRFGYTNGLTRNKPHPIPMADRPTLPGVLADAGYQTRAVGKMHFHPPRGHYGFQHMEILQDYYRQAGSPPPMGHGLGQNELEPGFSTVDESRSLTRWTVDRSIDFLETRDDTRPFFLWTSFAKPHPPLDCDPKYWSLYEQITMPDPARGDWSTAATDVPAGFRASTDSLSRIERFSPEQLRAARRAYYACITQIDYNLGQLFARLRELGLADNTWIIFTSDHGEMLGDHWMAAKGTGFEGSARVPLLVRPPAADWKPHPLQGRERNRLVCLADLMPTCLHLAGVAAPAELDGRDLLDDDPPARDDLVIASGDVFTVVRHDGLKHHYAARGGGELLFDLDRDPTETRNILADRPADAEALRARLAAAIAEHRPDVSPDGRTLHELALPSHEDRAARRWPGLHSRHEPQDLLH